MCHSNEHIRTTPSFETHIVHSWERSAFIIWISAKWTHLVVSLLWWGVSDFLKRKHHQTLAINRQNQWCYVNAAQIYPLVSFRAVARHKRSSA